MLTFFFLNIVVAFNINDYDRWNQWKIEFNKEYKTKNEELIRYNIWKDNLNIILKQNHQHSSASFAVNKFSDLTHSEFKQYLGLNYKLRSDFPTNICDQINGEQLLKSNIPPFIDWRLEGAVTPVKNQVMCGSCWAFSAIGALEGMNKLYGDGTLQSLSEQQLVDCSFPQGNFGCGGGLMDQAYNYTKQHGSCSEKAYPYIGRDDIQCRDVACDSVVQTRGCANIWTGDIETTESVLNYVVSQHPVSVAVAAGNDFWQNYRSGIVNSSACYDGGLDHGVVIVGYNSSVPGSEYWIVKNSWGPEWGINGYIYIGMYSNICGIAELPSFPLLAKSLQ